MAKDLLNTDDSSNFLGHFIGTVEDSFWATPREQSEGKATYEGADKPRLYWHVRIDDVLQEMSDDAKIPETLTLSFTIGDGWEATEDGGTVRHTEDPTGKEGKLFKASSVYGQVIGLVSGKKNRYTADKVVVMDGGDDPVEYDMKPVAQYLRDNDIADPRDAKIWEGLQFEFRGLGFQYRPRKGEEPRDPFMRPYPVRFVGVDDGSSPGAVTTHSSTEGSRAGSSTVDPAQVAATLPRDVTEAQATDLAKLVTASSSHAQFMRNALAMDWVNEDPDIKASVMDSDSGPWSVK